MVLNVRITACSATPAALPAKPTDSVAPTAANNQV